MEYILQYVSDNALHFKIPLFGHQKKQIFSWKRIKINEYTSKDIYFFSLMLVWKLLFDLCVQTTLRLSWIIKNNRELQDAIANKTAMFGTIDSWLLYRLRQGNSVGKEIEHISDVSSCAATGFYDPFTLQWANWAFQLFSLNVIGII